MTTVYISCPMTLGNRNKNLHQCLEAQRILLLCGYAPLNPGLTMLCPFANDIPHAAWLRADLPWVQKADLVIRLPGESVGADMEVEHAKKHNIPVWFCTISDLEKMLDAKRNGRDPEFRG